MLNCCINKNYVLLLAGSKHLRLLLSFSVGGMLGDVFLHVLPEVWMSSRGMYHNIRALLLYVNQILFICFLKTDMETGCVTAGGCWLAC